MRNHNNAILDFKRVITAQPNNARAHFYLALYYEALSSKKKATQSFSIAQALNFELPEDIKKRFKL